MRIPVICQETNRGDPLEGIVLHAFAGKAPFSAKRHRLLEMPPPRKSKAMP